MRPILCFCASLFLSAALRGADLRFSRYDVRNFGAQGDGVTLDTVALQRTIEACAAAGGGTVYFPPGRYLSGTLVLRSRLTLHLPAGAVLLASTRLADYPVQAPSYHPPSVLLGSKHTEDYPMRHLLYAKDVENVVVEGCGAIDGQGDAFFSQDMKEALARPTPLLEFIGGRGLRVENIAIRNAPGWTVHAKNCDGVKVRGLTILNHPRAINSDGIDIDSSRNVIVSDCRITAGDDCIVLKATRGASGETLPVENVVVTNCVLESAASALKLGTESHADFRHVVFSNCVIRNSRTGIALFAKDGGTMEDVRFAHIVMTTKPKWGQGFEWPIVVEISKRTADSGLSAIRDVAFSDLTVYTKGRVRVSGLPERAIEGVSFRNVEIRTTGYEPLKAAKPGREGPLDPASIPAACIFTHVRGLSLDGVSIMWPADASDTLPRHAVYGDHLEGVVNTRFHGVASAPGGPAIRIENSNTVNQ